MANSKKDKNPFRCGFCKKKIKSKIVLHRHLLKYHLSKAYKCATCGDRFDHLLGLCQHHESEHGNCGIKCSTCGKVITDPVQHFLHELHSCNSDAEAIQCPCLLCPIIYRSPAHHPRHQRLHHKGLRFKCEICHESFINILYLTDHRNMIHSETSTVKASNYIWPPNPMSIPLNGEANLIKPRTEQRNTRNQYKPKPNKGNTRKFKVLQKPSVCPICGQVFSCYKNMRQHLKKIHDRGNNYKCYKCQKPFDDKESYYLHFRSEHFAASVPCSDCELTFPTAKDRNLHSSVTHPKFTCKICFKVFVNLPSLLTHDNDVHKIKKYDCFFCSASFSNNERRMKHMRQKHANLMIKCDICSTPCENKEQVMKHKFFRHAECMQKRFFKCIYCLQPFTNVNTMRKHAKINHKEMLHKCSLCKMVYLNRHNLQNHLLNAHKKVVSTTKYITFDRIKCPTCGKIFADFSKMIYHYYAHTYNPQNKIIPSNKRKQTKSFASLKCKHCYFKCGSRNKLLHHMHSEHATFFEREENKIKTNMQAARKLLKCGRCYEKFRSTAVFVRHLNICNPLSTRNLQPAKPFHCSTCTKSSSTKKIYSCFTCGCKFSNFSSRRMHLLQCKAKSRQLNSSQLEQENRAFSNAIDNGDSGSSEISYTCKNCGIRFEDETFLDKHISHCTPYWWNKENKKLLPFAGYPKLYPCIKCGFCCVDIFHLLLHVKSEHPGFASDFEMCLDISYSMSKTCVGQFVCSFCRYESDDIEIIRKHMLRHVLDARRSN